LIDCAVILAVGSPAHKTQIAYNRPYAMLPALGKPLVIRIMNPLHRLGIREFIVVVGVNEGAVASYLNSQWVPDAQVDFMLKPNDVSLTKVLSQIAASYKKPFLVASYNSITHAHLPERLLKQHAESPETLILSGAATTLSQSQQHFFAEIDDSAVKRIVTTQPTTNNAVTLTDIAICGQAFVDHLAKVPAETDHFHHQFMDIAALYVQGGGMATVAHTAWVLQIETDYDLLRLNRMLFDEPQDAHTLSEVPASVQITPPVRIDPQVTVGRGAHIGPYVYLEKGCTIGPDTVVENAIILQNATVAANSTVKNVILSPRGQIV
jgi:NDP-sugar pyrophosphorylase family protein